LIVFEDFFLHRSLMLASRRWGVLWRMQHQDAQTGQDSVSAIVRLEASPARQRPPSRPGPAKDPSRKPRRGQNFHSLRNHRSTCISTWHSISSFHPPLS
jgi:hypothetical protein